MILQRGDAAVRIEFADGTVYAFSGEANLRLADVESEYQDPKGKKLRSKKNRRAEVVVLEERD